MGFEKSQTEPLDPLEPRSMSSGLAKRTLKNLDFIKHSTQADVHPVTQVVNSLLSLLVFPIEQEKQFLDLFSSVRFPALSCSHCGVAAPDLSGIQTILTQKFSLSSLKVVHFQQCPNLGKFIRRLRNAISHKYLWFSGPDPDSKSLPDVTVTLKDKLRTASDFDWEISMTAEDLEKISRYVAFVVIDKRL